MKSSTNNSSNNTHTGTDGSNDKKEGSIFLGGQL